MGDIANYTKEELLEHWDKESDMNKRDELIIALQRKHLFPTKETNEWESKAGLYPATNDPEFTEKLMRKQEFIENLQETLSSQQKRKINPCNSNEEFELSPPQRFITRFLSPQSPYVSALLYHGVGVGKTCAAISTAEEYLRVYPRESIFIIAPRNIQSGFRRTIFDEESLMISTKEDLPNTLTGCTGNSYLMRTGMEYEREKSVITRKIKQAIDVRYTILGYVQFYRYIRSILDRVPPSLEQPRKEQEEIKLLRREFSGRLVIIDEAHNLRDVPGETDDDNLDIAGGDTELSESKAGKRLTPLLMRVVKAAEGMKLLLLTGTPMYNNYNEIIFLLNLLLLNDKKAPLMERDIFLPTGKFSPGGEEKLGVIASAYLSFMRGENPLSFPVRLYPQGIPLLEKWPGHTPKGDLIFPKGDREAERRRDILLRLPFVPINFKGDEQDIIRRIADEAVIKSQLSLQSIDEMVQSGNWLFPAIGQGEPPRIREAGFQECFEEIKSGTTLSQFKSNIPATWLKRDQLHKASPKSAFILERIQKTIGVVFVYSRFVKSGALPFAIALEANGYTAYGRTKPLFVDGIVDGLGRQCALCEARERAHGSKSHKFSPAFYVLLTGQAAYSPNNAASIQAARSIENVDGKNVKIVIGSQVASEGIDLRFVREIYVFDSWFHLNKMEQVLGRGVRTCSHSLLPEAKRNCTIHLLVNMFTDTDIETADLYMYRNAMTKALQIGSVTRVLKRYALDCNLNHSANFVKDLDPIDRMEDSRGEIRENVEINDTPFTSVCDWIECPYTCEKIVDIEHVKIDMSTYDEYSVRWRELQIKNILKRIFESKGQPMIQIDSLIETFRAADIPEIAIRTILGDIVGKSSFRIRVGNQEGYIIYRNTYYLFQPIYLADFRIPLALRVADIPVRKDEYTPTPIVYKKMAVKPSAAAPEAAADAPDAAAAAPEAAAVVAAADAPDAAADAPDAAADAPDAPAVEESTGSVFWKRCKEWSRTIETATSPLDIPPNILEIIEMRYNKDDMIRVYNYLSMISWTIEYIQRIEDEGSKLLYAEAFAKIFLELIWDEFITSQEQLLIIKNDKNDPSLAYIFEEQLIKIGAREAYRYINLTTGVIEYQCGNERCSQALRTLFDTERTNPVNNVQANNVTTGNIYGFIVPKIKDMRLVFKTNDRPIEPGKVPEKGGECEIVSGMEIHKKQLRAIRDITIALGYPELSLSDVVLDEKDERKKKEVEKKRKPKEKGDESLTPAQKELIKLKLKLKIDERKFQNVIKACALKNIMLRFIDRLEKTKQRKRYFYRPISSIKSKHFLQKK